MMSSDVLDGEGPCCLRRSSFDVEEGRAKRLLTVALGIGGVVSCGDNTSLPLTCMLSNDVLERKNDRRLRFNDLRFCLDVGGVEVPPSIESLASSFSFSFASSSWTDAAAFG